MRLVHTERAGEYESQGLLETSDAAVVASSQPAYVQGWGFSLSF